VRFCDSESALSNLIVESEKLGLLRATWPGSRSQIEKLATGTQPPLPRGCQRRAENGSWRAKLGLLQSAANALAVVVFCADWNSRARLMLRTGVRPHAASDASEAAHFSPRLHSASRKALRAVVRHRREVRVRSSCGQRVQRMSQASIQRIAAPALTLADESAATGG
jgi:hypothetical protein